MRKLIKYALLGVKALVVLDVVGRIVETHRVVGEIRKNQLTIPGWQPLLEQRQMRERLEAEAAERAAHPLVTTDPEGRIKPVEQDWICVPKAGQDPHDHDKHAHVPTRTGRITTVPPDELLPSGPGFDA